MPLIVEKKIVVCTVQITKEPFDSPFARFVLPPVPGGAVRCNREALPAAPVGPFDTSDAPIDATFGSGRQPSRVL